MHIELVTRRRVLLKSYRRYLEADRAWEMALGEMRTWFPAENRAGTLSIGNPGSTMRRKYACRERALRQLEVVRIKLQTARQRLTARRLEEHPLQTIFISHIQI